MAEACRAFGAPGHRGQRQPLQRERRGRHRPDAGARACSAWSSALRAPAAGAGLAGGRHPACCWAPALGGRRARSPWTGPAGPPSAGRTAAGRCPPSTSRAPRGGVRLRGRAGGRHRGRRSRRAVVSAVHDVSSGGLAVALAEMAVAAGTGCVGRRSTDAAELFTELPSRFVVATTVPDELAARAAASAIPCRCSAGPAATASRSGSWSISRWRRCARPTRAIWPACWGNREGAACARMGTP